MIGSAVKNAFSAMTGISGGDFVQKGLQALGMDKSNAAYMGAMKDLSSGNLVGYHQNLTEAFTGSEKGGAHAMAHALASSHCPAAHFCGAPGLAMTQSVQRVDLKNKRGGIMGALGGAAAGFALGGPFGAAIGGAIGALSGKAGSRCKAKCMERRMKHNPVFRAQMEASMGGRYVPDCRNDGKITIVRNGLKPMIPGLAHGAMQGLMGNAVAGSCLSGMHRGMANATKLMQSQNYLGQAAYQGVTPSAGEHKIRMNAKPGGEVSKLPVPTTFEDLVAAFMIDTVKSMEEELKAKMAEYEKMKNGGKKDGAKGAQGAEGAGGAGGAGRSGRSRGGLFGSLLGGLGKMVGGMGGGLLGSIVSPIMGTALGGGVGSALGGMLGGGAGGVLDGVTGMLGFGGGGPGGAGGAGGAAMNPKNSIGGQRQSAAAGSKGASGKDEDSRQIMFEKIKNLMQKLTQALQSLSNVMNTMHQGSMNAIRNIRA